MINPRKVRILTYLLLPIMMSGCGALGDKHDISMIRNDAHAINKELNNIELIGNNKNRSNYSWVQPDNKNQNCKIYISNRINELISTNGLNLYWDGDCREGYAKGLGREFVDRGQTDGTMPSIYILSEYPEPFGSTPAKYIEHDLTNNVIKEGDLINGLYVKIEFSEFGNPQYGGVNSWLRNQFEIDDENIRSLSFGYMDDTGTSKVTELLGVYAIRRSITNKDGITLDIDRNLGDSTSYRRYDAYTYLSPKSNANELRVSKYYQVNLFTAEPGTVFSRLINATLYLNAGARVQGHPAPDDYLAHLDEVEKNITRISEKALHERFISLAVKTQYIDLICNDHSKVDFINNRYYKDICISNNQDLKISNLILNVDNMRKNKERLSGLFIAKYSEKVANALEHIPTPKIIDYAVLLFNLHSVIKATDHVVAQSKNTTRTIEFNQGGNEIFSYGLKDISGSNIFVNSFGREFRYNLQNPVDRVKYRIDVGAQLRDSLDSSPLKNIESITLQAGGGVFQNTAPILWEPIQLQ